jgi:signal transduction histidine kinase
MTVYPSSRTQVEQIIAASRVAIAASSLLALWLDPAEAARFAHAIYTLHLLYLVYACGLLALAWRWRGGSRLALATHALDIVTFSVFQYLTLGPSSPFFIYFVFSMFCAALRWGWRGTLSTSAIVGVAYLAMTVSMPRALGSADFELNRIITRVVYLVMAAAMLVYLGRYEARLRTEIERLARWPATAGASVPQAATEILRHAAQILEAGHAVIVWETDEEPGMTVAAWSADGQSLTEHSPIDLATILPEHLVDRTFLVSGDVEGASSMVVRRSSGTLVERGGFPLVPALLRLVQGRGLVTAPFRTDRLSGRVFFTDLQSTTAEIIPLTEVVAREIGTSLDRMHVTHQLQEIAASEERIRVARDLHDGVLQSLTGIRFELRAVATTLQDDAAVHERLVALERALSIEQRELRFFIGGLKPAMSGGRPSDSLSARLESLRERLALEWTTPVSIRISPESQDCRFELAQAAPLMVHEAVVNALKHARPTQVNVNVDSAADRLRIVVSDDGQGFPFKGHFDHRALGESQTAPRSLFDRVTALGGKMSIESSDQGSRIEMVVSL